MTREILDSVLRSVVASMQDASVIVDVSIDQGGCSETSRPTAVSRQRWRTQHSHKASIRMAGRSRVGMSLKRWASWIATSVTTNCGIGDAPSTLRDDGRRRPDRYMRCMRFRRSSPTRLPILRRPGGNRGYKPVAAGRRIG